VGSKDIPEEGCQKDGSRRKRTTSREGVNVSKEGKLWTAGKKPAVREKENNGSMLENGLGGGDMRPSNKVGVDRKNWGGARSGERQGPGKKGTHLQGGEGQPTHSRDSEMT